MATIVEANTGWKNSDFVAKFKYENSDPARYEVTNLYKCPYGKSGDILWVRETWQYVDIPDDYTGYVYKASGGLDWEMSNDEWIWRPSIFMPRAACRIFLQITDVRVERLQDISEADAIAEGVEKLGLYPGYDISSRGKFNGLWTNINGAESWEKNPWVWVISFKRIERPVNFDESLPL